MALNGPAVGGGAAWFTGIADTIFAADSTYLQVPFSSLGLVPENGAARTFAQSIGVHRANDIFIYGKKVTATELQQWGMVSEIFPTATFLDNVKSFLERQLEVNDAKSMMITKQLQNAPLRTERIVALSDAVDALHERFVTGDVLQRFLAKIQELNGKLTNNYNDNDRIANKNNRESRETEQAVRWMAGHTTAGGIRHWEYRHQLA